MPWQLLDDLDAFAHVAVPMLSPRPAENTIPLSIVAQLGEGVGWSDEPPVYGLHAGDDGTPDGAVLMTPPHNLVLAEAPLDSLPSLVEALVTARIAVPGAAGTLDCVAAFTSAWNSATGAAVTEQTDMRLYVLDGLRQPDPAPAGSGRLAALDDLDLVCRWLDEFHRQTHDRRASEDLERQRAAARIEQECTWLWVDGAGEVVSIAGRTPAVAGVARVGPVYTPIGLRGHGYGTAVTAACTAGALAAGAADVVLFTDLANPTSNSIYQKIGYRAVEDRRDVRFVA